MTTGGALTTAGTLTTQNNNVTINAVGAARTLTLNESLTVGDGNDGTITFSGASKTLTVEDTSLVNQVSCVAFLAMLAEISDSASVKITIVPQWLS